MLEHHMKKLQEEMELKHPFPNSTPGTFTIPLEEDFVVFVSVNQPEGFTITCNVAKCPEGQQEQFLTELLLSNLFGQGTHGAILGIKEDQNMISLEQQIETDVEYEEFSEILQDFLNTADFWREESLKRQSETPS